MANTVIATVVAVEGTAYARNADGELREISAGDALLQGETVVTPQGATVQLALADGNPFQVSNVEEMVLSRDLVATTAASADESAVEDETIDQLLAALEDGQDLNEVLEETAAGGGSGGGEGAGHGWVRLGRIVESTSEFHGIAAPGFAGDDAPVEQSGAIIAVDAIDDSETTEEGEPVVVDVQQNDDFLEGSIVTSITQPGNGSAVINSDNTVTYTPAPGFTGIDTFTYTAVTPDGTNSDTAVVTITVLGDPPPPPPPAELPSITIDDDVVIEGEVATLTIRLSEASDTPVTVRFTTNDDTATVAGGDYDPASGLITFAPGQTEVTLQFQTNSDELLEGTEQFLVDLSDPEGAVIADDQGVVTILEGTAPPPIPVPSISIDDVTVVEGETAVLTLTLSGPSDLPVTVQFASADDTATVSGGDYDPDTGTVTFAPGQTTVTLSYSTNTDSLLEGVEQFLVNLSNPGNATIADDQGVVTIIDGSTPPPPPPPPPPPADDEPTVSVTGGVVDEAALAGGSNAASSAETTNGAFSITTGVDQLASLVVGGVDVTAGGTVQGQYGTLTVSVSGGAYSWVYELGAATDHPDAGSTGTAEGVSDEFAVVVTDDDGDSASASLVVDILDDGPSATEDLNTATEAGPDVTGNVLVNDASGADAPATVTAVAGGSVGVALAGSFGTLTLQADGSYVYTPDASVPDGAQDVFTYEITDADGDVASTTLTINYAGDGSIPTAENGAAATGDATLGSDSGSLNFQPGTDTPVTFAATYDGGLGAASQDSNGGVTTFSAIDGSWTLTIDETSGAYAFTQLAPYTHQPGTDSDSAQVSVTLTDSDGSVATATLDLSIADDVPAAFADGNTATESGPVVDGNVLDNDDGGADGGITVTGLTGGTVGTALAGSFGTLVLQADGSYAYTPNTSVPAGSQDVFTYEITDADGDVASTTLTITFSGDGSAPSATDGAAATFDATLGSDSGSLNFQPGTDTPVTFSATYDGGLGAASQGSSGGVTTFSAVDGSWTLTIDEATGAYQFNQLAPYSHDVGADQDTASVQVTLTDSDGSEAQATLSLSIGDDGPTANADSASATEDGPAVNGNVLDNDDSGADGGITVTGLTGGTVGTALAGSFGTLVLQADGSYAYTPNANVPGGAQDVFTYEITDADGDTSSTTLTLTFDGDNSAPVASDAVSTTDDALLGSDSGSMAFGYGTDTPVTFSASYDGGLGAASQSSVGGVTTFAANDGSWTLAINEASGDYTFTQLAPYAHDVSADADAGIVSVSLTDSDGSQAAATLTLNITDDEPTGADNDAQVLNIPISEQTISDLSAQWLNVQGTGSGSVTSSGNGDGVYLDWGNPASANGQSGYDFLFEPGTTSSQGITTDSLFSLGTLSHNNFSIYTGSSVLQSADLQVFFDLTVDGVVIPNVSTTISLVHTETDNAGPDPRDIMQITASGTSTQTITVGGRTFVLEIEGFLDANGNLVDTVYTEEGQVNTFGLYARLSSTDDLPNLQGTVNPGDFGADGPAAVDAVVWDGIDGSGNIQGQYGVLTITGVNPDGTYNYDYTLSAATRDALQIGDTLTESFDYTLTDSDGDSVESTFTLELNGVANADLVDGIVEGMAYETSSGLTGITDESGSFSYRQGDTVTFSIGGVVVGSVLAAEAVADGKVFLQEIAGTELGDLNDEYVENMAVFLQSLDADGDAYNGIVIEESAHSTFADSAIDLTAISGAELQAELEAAGYSAVSEEDAMQHVRDMLEEHAGVTEFDEHVADSPVLLGSAGDDVFAFSLSEDGQAGEDVTVVGFGEEGSDTLDLRDLLQGEEAEGADLTNYLAISSDGTDTVIKVSADGAFTGTEADAGHVDQTITLAGVDLVSGHDDLQSVIQSMMDAGKLNVDH